jgi:hypothetical protein
MGTVSGNDGIVRVGTAAVAKIDSFSFSESATTTDNTGMGDVAETHMAGKVRTSWTARVQCHYDPADTTAQGAMDIGASLAFEFRPEGSGSGARIRTGTGTVTDREQDQTQGTETVKVSFSIKGNGVLGESTLP